eukprot:TRINITY_DN22791_c0_g1_i2.p1 TRINITY_DN22791_c0_g1~~TRINITY_DN22791_c0_g1_i2.p1  ORF type:complete len:189 (+),score=44.66 TRINITY_DN22791_c0_g1_i2:128-694(+)
MEDGGRRQAGLELSEDALIATLEQDPMARSAAKARFHVIYEQERSHTPTDRSGACARAVLRFCGMVSPEVFKAEHDNILAVFRECDDRGNGMIDLAVFRKLLLLLEPVYWTEERVARLLEAMGANDDGLIRFEEMLAWLWDRPHQPIWTNVAPKAHCSEPAELQRQEELHAASLRAAPNAGRLVAQRS